MRCVVSFLIIFVLVFSSFHVYAFDPVAEAEAIINNVASRQAVTALLKASGFNAVAAANEILQKAAARQIVQHGLTNVVMNPAFNSSTGVFSYILPAAGAAAIGAFLLYDVVQKLKSFKTGEVFDKFLLV